MYEQPTDYTNYDPNGQTPQELLARLLTLQNSLRSTVTSLGEAQSLIEQHADEIELRVEKSGVIAAINLSPETIRIQASNIDLVGAVTVLSDITGDLGSITAGNIYGVNIFGGYISSATDIDIGQDLNIGVASNGAGFLDYSSLNFGNYASISSSRAFGFPVISFSANKVDFSGVTSVDLSSPSVSLPSWVASQSWVSSQDSALETSIMNWVTDNFVAQ